MTELEMTEIARGNVERNLAAEDEDSIYEEAYTLAVDALLDAGVERTEARRVALDVAMCYACP